MAYAFTTQSEARDAFWQFVEDFNVPASKRKIRDYSGHGKMHNTDTRTAFVDSLARDGQISESLAQRVTL